MSWFIQVITKGHTGWKYCWEEQGCCWNCWACPVSVVCVLSYSGLGLLSLLTLFEDQALKLLWSSEFVLSCSGLDPCFLSLWGPSTEDSSFCVDTFLFGTRLLLLRSRTKYQISHTVGRHDLGRAPLFASKYSSHPPHWGYPEAAQVLLTFYLQKTPCHTTCPLDITL